MKFNSVIFLIQVNSGPDEIGNHVEIVENVKRQILAEKKSVRQSEFYQAASAGLKPEITFVVWSHEYIGESKLEFEGKTFTIIRTFERSDRKTELICEVKTGG
jgi:SPP1 family predicted phage head-tail adaptor